MGLDHSLSDEALATLLIQKIRELSHVCCIPASLQEPDIPKSALEEMAKAALLVQRLLANNPREVHLDDAIVIYKAAYSGTLI